MNLPPLYKYLNIKGAELTLSNRNFRHAKPSDFNDEMDMTVQKLFPEEELEHLTIQKNNFNDIILKNLHRPPTCINLHMRQRIALLQTVYRNNPEAAKLVKETMQDDDVSDIYDIDRLRRVSEETINEINRYLQEHRVLCVSKNNDSDIMWERYAENDQGIVLRILPSSSSSKDSKFKLFREVKYQDVRPTLYADTFGFIEDGLFGNPEETHRRILENIIYTKTKKWEYENEFRLAIPVFSSENWNTLPCHPEEISELYLGAQISESNRHKFIHLAKSINPDISIFQAFSNFDGRLNFAPV